MQAIGYHKRCCSVARLIISTLLKKTLRASRRTYSDSPNVNNEVRVRFAPSPTGMLHVGGLRTVLINYAFARSHKGKFIVRIEDTDQKRIVQGALDNLRDTLNWLGIVPDESPWTGGPFGPYLQSERLAIYKEKTEQLLENGSAYRCFCSPKRLDLLRKEALRRREVPGYDNQCRSLQNDEINARLADNQPFVVRLKLSSQSEPFHDLIMGSSTLTLQNEGDPVLLKSDGFPTYHLANVVDDHFMKISHVLRGQEWSVSTIKHLLLYRALGYEPPQFAHLPLLINSDGSKLSKRQGSISVEDFKNKGFHPEVVLNFVASLGSQMMDSQNKVLSMDELVQNFSLDNIKSSASRIDMNNFNTLNQRYIRQLLETKVGTRRVVSELQQLIRIHFKDRLGNNELQIKVLSDANVEKILNWGIERIQFLKDLLTTDFEFLWIVPDVDTTSIPYNENDAEAVISRLSNALIELPNEDFNQEKLNAFFKNFAKESHLKFPALMKFLRLIICSISQGPSIAEIFIMLGKEATLERLQHAKQLVKKKHLAASV